jgi:hypothetical protein
MRRFVASLVLSAVAWGFGGSMALELTGASVSACCRRSGKHHCMSVTSGLPGVSSDAVSGVRSKSPACPYFSLTATPVGVARPEGATVSELQAPAAVIAVIEDGLSLDSRLLSCNSQRGPPTFQI